MSQNPRCRSGNGVAPSAGCERYRTSRPLPKGAQSRQYALVTEDAATASTRLLRTGNAPVWQRLRTLQDFDPRTVALATLFTDDVDLEFGILVTTEGRVFEFDLRFDREGDLKAQVAAASFTAWTETTDRWRERPFRSDVESAIRLLAT